MPLYQHENVNNKRNYDKIADITFQNSFQLKAHEMTQHFISDNF